jgi:hypothetical protein
MGLKSSTSQSHHDKPVGPLAAFACPNPECSHFNLRAIKARVATLGIGTTVNISHLERLNGTMRCQQARLARRPRCVSRDGRRLQGSLWLWRDLYNWVRVHGALEGRTPAMAAGLSERVWSVLEYIRHPVHVDDLIRAIWAEEREIALASAFDRRKPRKTVPSS